MDLEIGKTYKIEHLRKGTFEAKCFTYNAEWATFEVTKGVARALLPQNVARVGGVIEIRYAFFNATLIPDKLTTKKARQARDRSIPKCPQCGHQISLLMQEQGVNLCAKCHDAQNPVPDFDPETTTERDRTLHEVLALCQYRDFHDGERTVSEAEIRGLLTRGL